MGGKLDTTFRDITSHSFQNQQTKGNMAFDFPPSGEAIQLDTSLHTGSLANVLTRELFASQMEKVEALPWNLVMEQWRDLAQKGLSIKQRDSLRKKYSPSEILPFLKVPKLNPELKSGLKSNSVSKRDEYNTNQNCVGIVLCALGEVLSDLL